MEMSFEQYIENPLGVKGAVFSQRDLMKKNYTDKFDAIFLREAGKLDYRLLYDKRKDEYYIHLKIPSEEINDFYYDVVVQFYTKDNKYRIQNTLINYNVRFFSNDPSFVYTYFNVFMKNDMLVKCLKSKSSKLAIKKSPDTRNPYQMPGYVKSIYFAYLFMKLKNLFFKQFYEMDGEPFSEGKLSSKIRHTDVVLNERQELQKKKNAEKRKEKQEKTNEYNKSRSFISSNKRQDNKNILHTSKVKSVSRISGSNTKKVEKFKKR